MNNFTWLSPTQIIFGNDSIKSLEEVIQKYKAKNVSIITDQGIMGTDILEKVKKVIGKDIETNVFCELDGEPDTDDLKKCKQHVIENQSDVLIGLGGGSSIDVAKAVSVLVTNESIGLDQNNEIENLGLPTIMIPTTAGTGAELTKISIFSGDKVKLRLVHDYLYPNVAICDPKMTLSMPGSITTSTGMDALTHAIEAYTSVKANYLTDIIAFEAIKKIYFNIRTAYAKGENIIARENMLAGSLLAGMAFSNAGVGAVHAMAYPIGGSYHIPHGIANSLLLPHVLEANFNGIVEKLAVIGKTWGLRGDYTQIDIANKTVELIKNLSTSLDIPQRLRDFDIPEAELPELAKAASEITGLMQNNPSNLSQADLLKVYKNAY
ncbi:iron-containing alcohol dehydrogenase [Natranaerofaba carboxydovora]|uniref:iron-containing alcohol dehydrogenase n=1 Tax=Natranaerofaba carboxydovora TaxID=2742683 RepID=UPI001F13E95A|nr:iron-containing alcohol dehydrogenase [Natranaerofaba carboxydovora]UMZ73452.1 Long-chain-alcohol dehydrogenase 1 [Natranaerofaba carboxydovora]